VSIPRSLFLLSLGFTLLQRQPARQEFGWFHKRRERREFGTDDLCSSDANTCNCGGGRNIELQHVIVEGNHVIVLWSRQRDTEETVSGACD